MIASKLGVVSYPHRRSGTRATAFVANIFLVFGLSCPLFAGAVNYRWVDSFGLHVETISNRCADVGTAFTARYATYLATPPFQVVSCSGADPVVSPFTLTYKRATGGNLTTTVTSVVDVVWMADYAVQWLPLIGLCLCWSLGVIAGQQR